MHIANTASLICLFLKLLAERVGRRHLDVLRLTSSGVDLTDEPRADRVVVTLTPLCHLFFTLMTSPCLKLTHTSSIHLESLVNLYACLWTKMCIKPGLSCCANHRTTISVNW